MFFFAITKDATGAVYNGQPQLKNMSPFGEGYVTLRRVVLDVVEGQGMAIAKMDESYPNVVDVKTKNIKKKGNIPAQKLISSEAKVAKPIALDNQVAGFYYFINKPQMTVNTRSISQVYALDQPKCLANDYALQSKLDWGSLI